MNLPDNVFCGALPPFGISNPFLFCEITETHIVVNRGFFTTRTQQVELHRIVAKETRVSLFGKWFHYGTVKLTTSGYKTPDIEIAVKEPKKLIDTIDAAAKREALAFRERTRQQGGRKGR